MSGGRRFVLGLACCAVALAAGGPAMAGEPALAVRAPIVPAVSVVAVARQDLSERIAVSGSLVPRDEILVTPEVDGLRITHVLVEEGLWVEKGQVLARLSKDLVTRQLAQQAALIDKAAAAVKQSESSIVQAEAAEVEARLSFERAGTLLKTGYSTPATMETRTSAARTAEGKLAFARTGLTMAKAELAQALATRDELELRLARTEILAPEAGIVSRRTARVGAVASANGDPLFRLIARGEIELEGEILETRLSTLAVGAPAWLELENGDTVQGSVRALYPEVDRATRLGKVRIRLDADPRLRIGAFGRGGIEMARSRGLAIPVAAVLYGAGRRSSVLVVRDDRVEARAVRTGLADADQVLVVSGLAEGERVVSRAGSFLRDGDRVRPVLTAASVPEPDERPEAMTPAASGRILSGRVTAEAGLP